MIDFHTHILPNIDDGAKSPEEMVDLLKEASNVGFEGVILTPHYIEQYYESSVKERTKIIKPFQNILGNEIKLFLGNEMYISNNICDLIKEQEACSLNNTRYVLFELPLNTKPINLYDVVYSMLQNGFRPILAHPERYSYVQQNPKIVNDLIEKGVLIQSNYGSFIGQYGRKAKLIIKKLLKNNMVHFLGSDVHKRNTIYPKIPQILIDMEKFIGKEKLEIMTTINPKLVLNNSEIDIEEPQELKLSLIEKMIMKKR